MIFINSLTSYCQQDLYFPLSNEFDWSKIEKQKSDLKAKLIKDFPNEFEYYRQVRDIGPNMKDLDSCLHVIDFNNDRLDDLIFDGWSGGEPRLISIFINNGKSFDKVFTDYQGIHKMIFQDNKVSKLYIQDWGCCCEYIVRNKIYSVNNNSKLPKIQLINQLQYIERTEFPVKYFDKPIKFEVSNNNYKIRFSPVIDDTTEVGYCGELRNGNWLGKIKSGTLGYALSEKSDTTGRIWWFVAIVPDSQLSESLYFDIKEESKSYKLGWISSRYVKRIEE
jgi:hypothetical protein